MKKFILFLICLSSIINSNSQNKCVLKDSTISYDYFGQYDGMNFMVKDSTPSLRTSYEYDSDGNLTCNRRSRYDTITSEWVYNYETKYTYDSMGMILSATFFIYQPPNYYKSIEKERVEYNYKYRTDNVILEINEYHVDVNRDTVYWKKEEFNENGNLIKVTQMEYEGYPVRITREVMHFNNEGIRLLRLVHNTENINDSTIWVPIFKEERILNRNNSDSIYAIYQWDRNRNAWNGSSKKEYRYNSDNKIIREIRYGWNSTEYIWNEIKKYEYIYINEKEKIIVESKYKNGNWIELYKTEITSRLDGKRLKVYQFEKPAHLSVYRKWKKKEYKYNPNDQMILREYFDWDTLRNVWVQTSKYEWNYMENELLSSELDYFFDSGEIQINYIRSFDYDDYGNIIFFEFFNGRREEIYREYSFYQDKNFYSEVIDTLCAGDTVKWEGDDYYSAGIYEKAYKSICNCDSAYKLILHEFPKPLVMPISGPVSVNHGEEYNYTIPKDTLLKYSWEIDKGLILDHFDDTLVKVAWNNQPEGTIYAKVINKYGCYSISSLLVNILNYPVQDHYAGNISVFPNPARDICFVSIPESYPAKPYRIIISDPQGRIINNFIIENELTEIKRVNGQINSYYLIQLANIKGEIIYSGKILWK
ncbi:MAG: hypothetical protein ACOCWA_04490 [Bacteroidota bacterium]